MVAVRGDDAGRAELDSIFKEGDVIASFSFIVAIELVIAVMLIMMLAVYQFVLIVVLVTL